MIRRGTINHRTIRQAGYQFVGKAYALGRPKSVAKGVPRFDVTQPLEFKASYGACLPIVFAQTLIVVILPPFAL